MGWTHQAIGPASIKSIYKVFCKLQFLEQALFSPNETFFAKTKPHMLLPLKVHWYLVELSHL